MVCAHTHVRNMATKAMVAKPYINTLEYIYVKLCIWLHTLCVVVITISQKYSMHIYGTF